MEEVPGWAGRSFTPVPGGGANYTGGSNWKSEFPTKISSQGLVGYRGLRGLGASSALEHEYVAPFHDPPKETSASFIAELKIDDNVKKTTANYREELYATLLPQEKDKAYRDRSTPGKNAPDYRRTSVVA
jgi:hypothetical protein